MAESAPSPPPARGRGKSRGGLGKYLRARGRGKGRGRPAEFNARLVLEDEQTIELEPDSEEAKEHQAYLQQFSKRKLGSNADRYKEPEPELNSDGEIEQEPEVDLSAFLERQKLQDPAPLPTALGAEPDADDDEVDESLAHLPTRKTVNPNSNTSRKGKVQEIEWDEHMEEMKRNKDVAEAHRDLKARFRTNVERQRSRPIPKEKETQTRKPKDTYVQAPLLPSADGVPKTGKEEMEDFLDDLLA